MKFDYIVSNPPFKLDFSDFRDDLEGDERFFAGIPKVHKKSKDKMGIYTLFLQHIIYSLAENGKSPCCCPNWIYYSQSGIDKKFANT